MAESNAAVRRKQLNVSIQQRLIDEARSAELNLSGVLEEALDAQLRAGRLALAARGPGSDRRIQCLHQKVRHLW